MKEIKVNKDFEGRRLDKFLLSFYKDKANFTVLVKLIRQKKITVNGKKVAIDYRVQNDDVIFVPEKELRFLQVAKEKKISVSKKDIEFLQGMIIFENENFFAINKPSGIAVQGGSKISFNIDSVIQEINPEYRLVHRIDKETSGILLIAKNYKYSRMLSGILQNNHLDISKYYLCLLHGKPRNNQGEIDYEIINEEGKKQEAKTEYKCLGYSTKAKMTLVLARLFTGRKHQIRIHFAKYLKCPIVGDKKYGFGSSTGKMFLHSYKVSFVDDKEKTYSITAEPDEKWQSFLKEIGIPLKI